MADQYRPFDFIIDQLGKATEANVQGIQQRGRDAREDRQQGRAEIMQTIREGNQAAAYLDPEDPEDAEVLKAWEAFKAEKLGAAQQAPGFDVPDIAMDMAGSQPMQDIQRRALEAQDKEDPTPFIEAGQRRQEQLIETRDKLVDQVQNTQNPATRGRLQNQIEALNQAISIPVSDINSASQVFATSQVANAGTPGFGPFMGQGPQAPEQVPQGAMDLTAVGPFAEIQPQRSPEVTLSEAQAEQAEEERRQERIGERIQLAKDQQSELSNSLDTIEEAIAEMEAEGAAPEEIEQAYETFDALAAAAATPISGLADAEEFLSQFHSGILGLPSGISPRGLAARARAAGARAGRESEEATAELTVRREQARDRSEFAQTQADLIRQAAQEVNDEAEAQRLIGYADELQRLSQMDRVTPQDLTAFERAYDQTILNAPHGAPARVAAEAHRLRSEEQGQEQADSQMIGRIEEIASRQDREPTWKQEQVEGYLADLGPQFIERNSEEVKRLLILAGHHDEDAALMRVWERQEQQASTARERAEARRAQLNASLEEKYGADLAELDYREARAQVAGLELTNAQDRLDAFLKMGLGLENLTREQHRSLIDAIPTVNNQEDLVAFGQGQFELWSQARRAGVEADLLEPLRIQAQIAGEQRDALETVLDTGVGINHLTDEQVQDLILRLPEVNNREELDEWAAERFSHWREVKETELRIEQLRADHLEVQVVRDEQEVTQTANEMKHEEWSRRRERAMAPAEDEAELVDTIANATRQGDTALLRSYLTAYDNRTPLGQHLRQHVTREQLEAKLEQAREKRDLDRRATTAQADSAEASAERTRVLTEQARLDLRENRALSEAQVDALRAQYERDEEQARLDLSTMALNGNIDRAQALSDLARAVPPEFWDNLPSNFRRDLERIGFSIEQFQGISETEEYFRNEPRRAEAWQAFTFMLNAPPQGPFEETRAAAGQLLEEAGVTHVPTQEGLLDILEGAWQMDANRDYRATVQTLAQLASQASEGELTIDALSDRLTDLNTVIDNQRQEILDTLLEAQVEGCGIGVSMGTNSMTFLPRYTADDGGERMGQQRTGTTCRAIVGEVEEVYENYRTSTDLQTQIRNYLNDEVQRNLEGVLPGSTPAPEPEQPPAEGEEGEASTGAAEPPPQSMESVEEEFHQLTGFRYRTGQPISVRAMELVTEMLSMGGGALSQEDEDRWNAMLRELGDELAPNMTQRGRQEGQTRALQMVNPDAGFPRPPASTLDEVPEQRMGR